MILRMCFSNNFQFQAVSVLAALLSTFALFQPTANAQNLTFDFIEAGGSNETLATIELAELPAFGDDIVSITFTQLGQSVFGFMETYEGPLDLNNGALVDDGMNGLQGSNNAGGGQLVDNTPPESALEVTPSNGNRIFLIEPSPLAGRDRLAFIAQGAGVGGAELRIVRDGDFRVAAVPEPSSLFLTALAVAGFASRRRRKIL